MRYYFRVVTAHPVVALCLAGLVFALVGPFVFKLTRDTSPDAFIPPDHPALALKEEVEESFGVTEPIAVGVIRDKPGGVFNPDTLRLIRDLTRAIQERPEIDPEDVMSLATESGVFFEDGEPGFEPLMKEVPETPEACENLKDTVLGYELYNGTIVAGDGSAACILLQPKSEGQADAIYRELVKLLGTFSRKDEQLVVAGEAAVRAHMGKAVSDDALRMNFVCPIVMALLIILAYRTVRGTVLPLCVIGGASALALGLMAASHIPVYIVTNGIFVIIMALGVADSLHLIGQYYEEQLDLRGRSKQKLIVDACMALWYPVLITSLTDVAGFFALYLGGIMPPIRYFGLFTCVGVMGALIYSYTVVPAGLMIRPLAMSKAFLKRHTNSGSVQERGGGSGGISLAPAMAEEQPATLGSAEPQHAVNPRDAHGNPGPSAPSSSVRFGLIGRLTGWLGALVYRRRVLVLVFGAAVLGVAGWGASKLVINDARILAFKDHHPIVQATNALNAHFDGTAHLSILVDASEKGAFLQSDVLRRIDELEKFTETLPYVGGTHSPAGWVKRAHQKMHEEDPTYYKVPDDPFDTQFYLSVLGEETSPMADELHKVLDETYTHANLIVRMHGSEYIHQREVIHRLQDYLDEHFSGGALKAKLAGRVNLDYHWLRMIRTSHINSVVLSFGCVLLLTGLMFRSLVAGLLCMFTAAVAVLINYAVMGFSGIPLGVGTAMFASIAIGAGVNFPIHMLDRLRISLRVPDADPARVFPNAFAFTGRVLFFTAFVVAVGFLLLCVSEFRTLVRFGLLIGVAMLVSFMASVTLLPAFVALVKPRFIWRRA
jgi:predicted RND superfamily exporter protein